MQGVVIGFGWLVNLFGGVLVWAAGDRSLDLVFRGHSRWRSRI